MITKRTMALGSGSPVLRITLYVLWRDDSAQETGATVAGKCMTCHKVKLPGLYNQWYTS